MTPNWIDEYSPNIIQTKTSELRGIHLSFIANMPPKDTNLGLFMKQVFVRKKNDAKDKRIFAVIMTQSNITKAVDIFKKKGVFSFDDNVPYADPCEIA